MRSGEPSHPLQPQSEVLWFLSEWQTGRVRTGRAANQLQVDCQNVLHTRTAHGRCSPYPLFLATCGSLSHFNDPATTRMAALGSGYPSTPPFFGVFARFCTVSGIAP